MSAGSVKQPGVFSPQPQIFAAVATNPKVSVVMTSWNDIRFLREAVDGVLAQTMTDFEFIVVDNGSHHAAAIAALPALDRRIRTLRLEHDVGAAEAGNRGIALARSPVIARMDNDDCAEPGWLAAVTAALEADPELGLVGTWANLMNEHGDRLGVDATPESDYAIRLTLLSHNPFYHSSTAYRRSLVERIGGIETGENLTHDHRLWRAMLPHCRARNLPFALCNYRYNPSGITGTSDPLTKRSRTHDIRIGLWRELGLDYPLEDRAIGDTFDDFLRNRPTQRPELWSQLIAIIDAMLLAGEVHIASFLRPGEEAARVTCNADLRARLASGPKPQPNWFSRLHLALRLRGLRRTLAAVVRRIGWIEPA